MKKLQKCSFFIQISFVSFARYLADRSFLTLSMV